jgi:hypothetical protein
MTEQFVSYKEKKWLRRIDHRMASLLPRSRLHLAAAYINIFIITPYSVRRDEWTRRRQMEEVSHD